MGKIKIILQMLQKLKVIIPSNYKKRIPLLFVAMVLSSLLEMLGIAVVMPFMTTLTDYETLMQKWYATTIMKIFGFNDFYGLLLFMGLAVVAVYVLKNIALIITRNYQNIFQ